MERGLVKAYLVVILLIVGAGVLIGATGDASVDDTISWATDLPDRIGGFSGQSFWYCQNDQCADAFPSSDLSDGASCPACGALLSTWSIGENISLPSDTIIARKEYRAGSEWVSLTVLTSGAERKSIHKPIDCLGAGGFVIQDRRALPVELADGRTIEVIFLNLARLSQGRTQHTVKAYWFESAERQTPYHHERLFWMAWDSVIHNSRSRWAYVSLTAMRDPRTNSHEKRMKEFIAAAYPSIRRGDSE